MFFVYSGCYGFTKIPIKKTGTLIINKLIEKIQEIKKVNPDLRVYLGASKDKEDFYKKFGFITRLEAGLGSGMILK